MIFKKGSRKVAAGCTHASVSASTKADEVTAEVAMASMAEGSIMCKLEDLATKVVAGVVKAETRLISTARDNREYIINFVIFVVCSLMFWRYRIV